MTFRLFCFVSHFFVLNYMPSLALDVPVNRHMSCICCSDKNKNKKKKQLAQSYVYTVLLLFTCWMDTIQLLA